MIDENALIGAISEKQLSDNEAVALLSFDDDFVKLYNARKNVRDEIIEIIEKMTKA